MIGKNHRKYYLTILVFVLCSQLFVISLQAKQTRAGRGNIVLSQYDMRLVERALHHLVRAPRPDMPDKNDPSLPPIVDLNLDEIRRILCMIREQDKKICDKIEDLQEELSLHDTLVEFDHEIICSKIEVVEEELEEHNEVVCSKLEELQEELEEHNEIVCSKLEILQENDEIICSKLEIIMTLLEN